MAPTAGAFAASPPSPLLSAAAARGGCCPGGAGGGRLAHHRCCRRREVGAPGAPPTVGLLVLNSRARGAPVSTGVGCCGVRKGGNVGGGRRDAGGEQPRWGVPVAAAAASSSSSPVAVVPAAAAAAAALEAASAAATDGAVAALAAGTWVKLICGASSTDAPRIRNTALAYTAAGVDCIDVAADGAVIAAAWDGIAAGLGVAATTAAAASAAAAAPARTTGNPAPAADAPASAVDTAAGLQGDTTSRVTRVAAKEAATAATPPPPLQRPLLMISVNDDADPHFRKAVFDPAACPADCPRPCAAVCPADAIAPSAAAGGAGGGGDWAGVLAPRCYGCGRCEPVCPLGLITTPGYVSSVGAVRALLAGGAGGNGVEAGARVDAIEIHTRPGHEAALAALWDELGDTVRSHQRLVAVSLPDHGDANAARLSETYAVLAGRRSVNGGSGGTQSGPQPPLPRRADAPSAAAPAGGVPLCLIWQTDGRPMSGDLGRGTARASVALGRRVRAALDDGGLPGYVQLAGGTNAHTATLLSEAAAASVTAAAGAAGARGSVPPRGDGGGGLAGVAYGGFARKLLAPVLEELEARGVARLEECPDLLGRAVAAATGLLTPIKGGVAARVSRP